jgi:hypothetical protein
MIIIKPDGIIHHGYGRDRFNPDQEPVGQVTNGPPSEWWCVRRGGKMASGWIRQPDHCSYHWQVLAYAANSCDEFLEELRKSS